MKVSFEDCVFELVVKDRFIFCLCFRKFFLFSVMLKFIFEDML